MNKNVFGEPLIACSISPATGFYRTGSCESGDDDQGIHTVCAIMTAEFLNFSKQAGNDLSTPRPEYMFSGLKPGVRWCLCALRWVEALNAGMAPKVVLEATNEKTLELVSLETLVKHAHKEVKA